MSYTQASLNRAVEQYCGELRNRVKLTRQHKWNGQRYEEIWDYPCVASVSSDGYFKANGHSCHMTTGNPTLIQRLRMFGVLGKSPTQNLNPHVHGKFNPLGNCAEQHAASKVLTRRKLTNLNLLMFGQARQVRDNALISPCATCKNVFPQLQ